jgi:DNA invertase Pin-like site-specific DNA recombinase
MDKQPVAYLRKSRVTTDRDMSWQVQEAQIKELAARHGDNGTRLELLSDWNKSGRKSGNRPGYQRLRQMIDGGEVSALYAYSLSRLSRSLGEYAGLAEACQRQGVTVRLCKEGEQNYATASGRFHVGILALLAEMEGEQAQERALDTIAARRARGDRIGQLPYGDKPGEDVAAVLQAYSDAGSVIGAGRLLNERGVPTRSGKPWGTTTVREILSRLNAMPIHKRPGAKNAAPFMLFHLVRCHCDRLMSASRFRNGPNYNYAVYRCIGGRTDGNHGRLNVSENKLMPWVKAEAGRFRVPADVLETEDVDAGRRLQIEARRRRVIDNYEDGLIDKADRDAKVISISEEMAKLDSVQRVIEIPQEIDWEWEPAAINTVLRAMWQHVQLDADMRPVEAAWRVPEWRASHAH